ncbi:MAG: POTRA domain-containing protein, partial [Pseudomonadota bacterium]
MFAVRADAQAPTDEAEGAPAEQAAAAEEAPPAAEQAPPAAEEAPPTFDIWEYRVLGNSRLSARQIEGTVYPFLGPAQTLDVVEEARRALEDTYREAGYFTVLVTIPQQEIDPVSGVVRLQVTEGEVDRLHVTGARYFSQRRIAEQLPTLAPGEVPTESGFREDLTLLAARAPDRKLQPVAKAGRYPGTVEFEVAVEDQSPFHFSAEVNDRFTIGTSRPRLSLNASYDNLFQREHSIGASFQTTPLEDEIQA